jgi:hypothetical protein
MPDATDGPAAPCPTPGSAASEVTTRIDGPRTGTVYQSAPRLPEQRAGLPLCGRLGQPQTLLDDTIVRTAISEVIAPDD